LTALLQSNLGGIPLLGRGKVRDLYAVQDKLLLVATDRISAFDHVLGSPIPGKGKILTQISLFWFDFLSDIVPNHIVTANVSEFPAELQPYADQLEGRSMLVKRADMFPVECVARGYLAGSGWKEYQESRSVCGVELPAGLKNASRLPEPIFTPATKAEAGEHDENITFKTASAMIGAELANQVRDVSIALYARAAEYALTKGIIIADTKFEFGLDAAGTLTLMDEVLTPDSSRYWPVEGYAEGQNPPSFDKQFVRDWLESVRIDGQPWNKKAPAPAMPAEVGERTAAKYREAFERLAG
jgi:phosphoribosylaminoimidazole-succinocarboxamide synthase